MINWDIVFKVFSSLSSHDEITEHIFECVKYLNNTVVNLN